MSSRFANPAIVGGMRALPLLLDVNACRFFIGTQAESVTLFNDNGVDPLTNDFTLNAPNRPALSNCQCSITAPVTTSVTGNKLVWNG